MMPRGQPCWPGFAPRRLSPAFPPDMASATPVAGGQRGATGLPPLGCQTYTWEMLGPAWTGTTLDILDAIAAAGYAGLELTLRMAGEFRDDPAGLRAACAERGLTLTTLAF